MDSLTLIGTALALAMDAFAVAIAVAISLNNHTWRHLFRLSWHFGLFQALMPIAGWLLGEAIVKYTGSLGNWAFVTVGATTIVTTSFQYFSGTTFHNVTATNTWTEVFTATTPNFNAYDVASGGAITVVGTIP